MKRINSYLKKVIGFWPLAFGIWAFGLWLLAFSDRKNSVFSWNYPITE